MPAKRKFKLRKLKLPKFKVKNWKLLLLGLFFTCVFAALGMWQLARAHQKERLLTSFSSRIQKSPYIGKDLNRFNDWRFYRAVLTGKFDNEHTFLLDNKTFQGKIGYDVYTPFYAKGLRKPILVNRGFIPLGTSRNELPNIKSIEGKTTIIGMINVPPLYLSMGKLYDTPTVTWPLRVQFINLPQIGKVLNKKLFPYVLIIDPKDPRAYATEWKVVPFTPDRHFGYAVQWFALAATLLILSLALNRVK